MSLDLEIYGKVEAAIDCAIDNEGEDFLKKGAAFIAEDLIACDADFEGWEIDKLVPYVQSFIEEWPGCVIQFHHNGGQ